MFTSYFAKVKYLKENGLIPIAICAKIPEWYSGLHYKELAPKYECFMEWKRSHNNNEFTERYKEEVLFKLDSVKVILQLQELAGTTDISRIVLICYEKSTDFCHRHIVSQWLQQHGISCEEWYL